MNYGNWPEVMDALIRPKPRTFANQSLCTQHVFSEKKQVAVLQALIEQQFDNGSTARKAMADFFLAEDIDAIRITTAMRADATAFNRLNDDEARLIAGFMQGGVISQGATFIQEGDALETDFMLLVLEGEVGVVSQPIAGERILPRLTLGPGSVIGEMAFLGHRPRIASCIALTELRVALLNQQGLARMLKEQPGIGVKFVLAIALQMSARLHESIATLVQTTNRQASLIKSEARFRSLAQLSSDWTWEQDTAFRFVQYGHYGNSTTVQTQDFEIVIGQALWDIPSANLTEQDWARHRTALESAQTFHDLEIERIGPDGISRWLSFSGMPLFDDAGTFCGYHGVGRNITDRKKAEADIQRLGYFDTLTNLPNRRRLRDQLQHALDLSRQNRRYGALLIIGCDGLKDINSTQGHDAGDHLLRGIAVLLRDSTRPADTVARVGEAEFGILLQELGIDAHETAVAVEAFSQKVIAAFNTTGITVLGPQLHSTPSIGIAVFGSEGMVVDDLLRRADLAMHQAKAAGCNTLRFFDTAMQAAITSRTSLESDLRLSIERQELRLYYQPVVDAHGGTIGAEALVRWLHPVRGLVSPATFIPLAEQTGLILPIGQWVLETACTQLQQWARIPYKAARTIAVNISAKQFQHPNFVNSILELIETTGINPRRLKLELTESLLVQEVEEAITRMELLRARGLKFSLDDFGTGYSSLSYLKRLPLDQLKIDQSFVRDLLTDPNDVAIVRTILALANSLGLSVVAEGVETVEQEDILIANGCRQFQGYLYSRPVPIEQWQ